jgi:hypothetical protein
VDKPEAVNVALVPSQIVELDEDKLNVGSDTDNDKVVVFVQPDAFDPVTVYIVVLVGLTVIVPAVNPPGLQV